MDPRTTDKADPAVKADPKTKVDPKVKFNSKMPRDCRDCEARLGGICGAMTAEELTELNRYTVRRKLHSGSEFQAQGQKAAAFANILKGVVKLSKVMADGRQQIVGLQFAPDFIGRPFSADSTIAAQAATDIEICSVSRAALERIVAGNAGLEHRLHDQTLRELDDARDLMLTLGRKNAKEKVASFLYAIAVRHDVEACGAVHFELPLTRQEISDFLGLTIETVSRQITRLRQEKVIHVENNRTITVHEHRASR